MFGLSIGTLKLCNHPLTMWRKLAMILFRQILPVCVLLVTISCADESPMHPNKSNKGINLKDYGIQAADTVQALLIFHRSAEVEDSSTNLYKSANVQAFVFNDDSLVDVSSLTVNGDSLVRISEGCYVDNTPTVPSGSTPTLTWAINGYRGGDFSHTFDMEPSIVITNLVHRDSITMAAGKTITYTGASGGDLYANVIYDRAYTELIYAADSNELNGVGQISKIVADNGSLYLSPADLSVLTPHRVYELRIMHSRFTTQPYAGTKIGQSTAAGYTIRFVLVP